MKVEAIAPYARVVVDTNVLLSAALLPGSVPAAVVDRILEIGELVFSAATFAELQSRLWKPKFDRYLSLERRNRLVQEFNASAFWVEIPDDTGAQRFSRDATDDAFVHAALVAGAVRLITGDEDLLCLHPVGELHIVTPRAALDELRQQASPTR